LLNHSKQSNKKKERKHEEDVAMAKYAWETRDHFDVLFDEWITGVSSKEEEERSVLVLELNR
jgi:hypothetical protein